MTICEFADIEYDFLWRTKRILAANDVWILRALSEAALIEVAVGSGRDACILLHLARLQFCGKLVYQRLGRVKTRIGVGILGVKIRDDARALWVGRPGVIIVRPPA